MDSLLALACDCTSAGGTHCPGVLLQPLRRVGDDKERNRSGEKAPLRITNVIHTYYNKRMTSSDPKPSMLFMSASRLNAKPVNQLISVRLSEDLISRLAEVGNAEHLSMSDTIRLVLERGLSATAKKKTKKGTTP